MQELEKILEEMEEGTHTFELLGRDVNFVAIDWVRDVIRKYMNDDIEIIEPCPHCENEVVLHWDVEKDGYEVYCPYCGFPMMLCSMCDARDGSVCDWEEIKGCKHSNERYRDFFYKHMNNNWISVHDRLPENAESKKGKKQRTTNADRIRQMGDDDLADFLIKGCMGESRAFCSHDEMVEWLRWEDSIPNGEG